MQDAAVEKLSGLGVGSSRAQEFEKRAGVGGGGRSADGGGERGGRVRAAGGGSRIEAVQQGRDERAGVRVACSVEVDGGDGISGHDVQRAVAEQETAIGTGTDQGGSAR